MSDARVKPLRRIFDTVYRHLMKPRGDPSNFLKSLAGRRVCRPAMSYNIEYRMRKNMLEQNIEPGPEWESTEVWSAEAVELFQKFLPPECHATFTAEAVTGTFIRSPFESLSLEQVGILTRSRAEQNGLSIEENFQRVLREEEKRLTSELVLLTLA